MNSEHRMLKELHQLSHVIELSQTNPHTHSQLMQITPPYGHAVELQQTKIIERKEERNHARTF